jgi:hypothetical protein
MSPLTESTRLVLKKDSVAVDPNTDPNFANVSLLLHGNGTNGSTSIIDSSPSPKSISRFNNAQISTAQSKFGGSSIAFDGSGDYLSVAFNSALDLIGSNFTIEAFVYAITYKAFGIRVLCSGGGAVAFNGTNGIHHLLQIVSGGALNWQWRTSTGSGEATSSAVISLNTWTHVSASVSGSVWYLSVNGAVTSGTMNAVRPSTNPTFAVATIPGENGSSTFAFAGYIDELRVTKGVARYTANFTPPTAPFPNY